METLQVRAKLQNLQPQFMYSLLSKLKPTSKLPFPSSLSNLKPFCTNPTTTTATAAAAAATATTPSLITTEKAVSKRVSTRSRSKVADAALLKKNWLQSLSCPLHNNVTEGLNGGKGADLTQNNEDWVIGVDPDSSGALALLRFDESGSSAQVFDTPQLNVVVGRRVRKRLNAKSIVQLLRSLDAPIGTTAYIEQSIPFPKDGKLGWWNGGFNYGIWIGILVASGFSVIPIPSLTWKNEFELSGSSSTKDDSRRLASTLFPSLSSSLTRKRDHGRAEALLIAAYAKGLGLKSAPSSVVETSVLNGSPFLSPDPA